MVLYRFFSGDTFGLQRTGITLSKYESSHLRNHGVAAFWVWMVFRFVVLGGFLVVGVLIWFAWNFFLPFFFLQNPHTGGSWFLSTEV